jgi:hypothetical protein
LHTGRRYEKSVSDEIVLKSEHFNQVSVILDTTEAGASVYLWGPIYVLQRGLNYPIEVQIKSP